MGFAIQRCATCTVAAVDEVVSKRRFNRLTALVEASIWVAAGLVLAETFHRLGQMPSGYPLSYLTVLGAVLLGLGAYIRASHAGKHALVAGEEVCAARFDRMSHLIFADKNY